METERKVVTLWQPSYWKIKEDKNMRHTLQPLTEKEQRFAEENHNLIYKYLHDHGYSIEEYYNIAVFGFLKAVQVYHRKEKLKRNYNFSYIASQYMRAELSSHFKMLNAKKRKPMEIIISLDADYAGAENLYNCTGGKSAEDEVMEVETIAEILKTLSEIQRKIIDMRMDGYSNRETFLLLEIKPSTYYKEMQRIKAELEKIVG